MDHDLKIWPEQFDAVISGAKKHEVRVFDRPYREGDGVVLREWDPKTEQYTGRETAFTITHITKPGSWGLPDNVGVFSIGRS